MRITIEIRQPRWLTSVPLKRARPLVLVLLLALVVVAPVLAFDRFDDVGPGVHHNDISAIAAAGITQGCNPPANTLYCPADFVRRDQMGSFLARTAGLGGNPPVANADKLDGLDSTAFVVPGAEAWHEIASGPGEPGFLDCDGFNFWTNFDANHNSAAYYKDPSGVVHLKGLMRCDGAATRSEFFFLPIGYLPAKHEVAATVAADAFARVDIWDSGLVELIVPGPSLASWVSLDGITFRAAP